MVVVVVVVVMMMMIPVVWPNTGSSSLLPPSRLGPQILPSINTDEGYV